MIIFPQALVLSAAAASYPLSHPRIGYQNYGFDLLPSAITVSSETADGPADAPLRPSTSEYWEANALPATWIADLGAVRDIDYVGIAGHTIGSSAAAIEVQSSPDGSAYTTFSNGIAPGNDRPLLFLDDPTPARFLKIVLTGTILVPRIAVIYMGAVLAMERQNVGSFTPINLSRQTTLQRSLSRTGQFLGQGFRRNGVVGSATFVHLDPTWYRDSFDPFVEHARRYPYFFAWCPEQQPEEVGYVWTDKDIAGVYMGDPRWMQVQWAMNGIANG